MLIPFQNEILMRFLIQVVLVVVYSLSLSAQPTAPKWMKHELSFITNQHYENPIYDIKEFYAIFTAPSGKTQKINGFWDGEQNYKVRFAPNELGQWTYQTTCSNKSDNGLHGKSGTFVCTPNESPLAIYQKGAISQPRGTFHLTYTDGTPFLWVACTAWNGALKSTEEEWDTYLNHRVDHHYSVIQLVTTQWRGCDVNSMGQVAFTGSGKIKINPNFYQHLDGKIDKVNEFGLVAAPVLLWALPFGEGRHLSPGYTLPMEEAVLLARYMVARYGANQVVWLLGGDGRYTDPYEQRWLEIGRRVFSDDPPGLVAQHPHGRSWIGDNHKDESWLDIVGYQSSHSNKKGTVDWINKGPIANRWPHLPARPIINLEPNYEEIRNEITDTDVRNASYWSLFATPMAGITYGANGIWPWIREGETILNHNQPKSVSTWRESIAFPGSIQIGYLSEFIQQFSWWSLRPANNLLVDQPGEQQFNQFISVVKSLDESTILAYIPKGSEVKIVNPGYIDYQGRWYNPRTNQYSMANIENTSGLMTAKCPDEKDWILVLEQKN